MIKKLEKTCKRALAGTAASILGARGRITPRELTLLPVRRLLVIRQQNQMGDMLLAVPAFRGLRRRFPDARITLVTASINRGVMLNNPYVDEVVTYAKEIYRGRFWRLLRFIRTLRRERYDAVIVLATVSFSVTSMLLAALSGARVRIGSTSLPFGHDLSSKFYHLELPLPAPEELSTMHESEHNLYPLRLIGVDETDLTPLLVPTDDERGECDRLVAAAFPERDGFVVVHPGAGKTRNIWPAERFAAVVRGLREEFELGLCVVRGPVDGKQADALLASCGGCGLLLSSPAVGLLGALMERAAVTLCNDTGVMHIGGAVRASCVAVFGPTDPARWKPRCDSVVAVRAADGLLESVTADDVLPEALQLVRSSKGSQVDP